MNWVCRTRSSFTVLSLAEIAVDRKMLSDIAIHDKPAFAKLVEQAKLPSSPPKQSGCRSGERRASASPLFCAPSKYSTVPECHERDHRSRISMTCRPQCAGRHRRRRRRSRAIEALRVDLLGKKGRVTDLLKSLGAMPHEQRKAFGEQVNKVKEQLSARLEARARAIADADLERRLALETIDVTPARPWRACPVRCIRCRELDPPHRADLQLDGI